MFVMVLHLEPGWPCLHLLQIWENAHGGLAQNIPLLNLLHGKPCFACGLGGRGVKLNRGGSTEDPKLLVAGRKGWLY